MNTAFLTALCVMTLTLQNVFKKYYNSKYSFGALTFNSIVILFAMLFFLVTLKGFSFNSGILIYCVFFAASYSLTTVTGYFAIATGSLAVTSLILSYSLIIPTLFGIVALGEPMGILKAIGIIILLVSLFLIRAQSNGEKIGCSFKWIIFVTSGFVTNGLCSVIQNMQQVSFSGSYKNEFMLISLAISFVAVFVPAVIIEKHDAFKTVKLGILPAAMCGISNGATNLLVMVIISIMASSVFFPILSAGQIVATFFISVMIFKEKFVPRQIAGIVMGVAAIILLNL